MAAAYGFTSNIIDSGQYRHVTYTHNISAGPQAVLHVYLEGDGVPWIRPNVIAVDPTGPTAFALQLMASDTRPSLFLGRPCYHGLYQEPNCSVLLWTHQRYSETVVASMAAALRSIIVQYRTTQVYLVGYSGGGVLAMLLAERISQIRKVTTIAANLDIQAWSASHEYSPLLGSLNPAQRQHFYQDLPQQHYAGGQDENVVLDIIQKFVANQAKPYIRIGIFKEFDHKCCWRREWKTLVHELESVSGNH